MIDLIKKLISQARGKTPAEKRHDLEKKSEVNALQKQKIDDEIKPLTAKIQDLKKRYEGGSKAHKSLLEPELKQLLRKFNSLKRERGIYVENETGLIEAIGRMREVEAYGRGGLGEDLFDDIAIELDEAADNADGVAAAINDLEKAGRRRNSLTEGDDDFADALAMFDEPGEVGEPFADELASFESDAAEIAEDQQAVETGAKPAAAAEAEAEESDKIETPEG